MPRSPIDVEKARLRRELLATRQALSPQMRQSWDEKLFRALTERAEYRRCRLLLAYYPIRGEIDVRPLVARAYADGKEVAFPVSDPKEHTMVFRTVPSLAELKAGAYGIPEPPCCFPSVQDFAESLCLVPALSFTKDGLRLGYGGGFYDRFLSDFDGCSVGLTYEALFSRSLPCLATDRRVQLILTEKGEVQ